MLKSFKIYLILIFLFSLAFITASNAEEEIEDLIDIFESKNKIIAVVEAKKTISFNLTASENVIWSGSKGYLGAFLTNDRFFVISTSSGTWNYLRLRSDEAEGAIKSLSPYSALLVTEDRAIGYDLESNRFIEARLPIHDELITAKADKNVSVVITSKRVLGLAAKSLSFTEISLRIRETVEDIKISSNKVTIRTSERLLTFKASGSTWNEHKL